MEVGYMPMPPDFKYLKVFLKGKPRHQAYDAFALKHPAMDCGRRAKIFSPFDALKGFSDAVASKDVQYISRPEMSDGDREEINRRLGILNMLTCSGRAARENRVSVRVRYFVLCTDKNNAACGVRGRIQSVSGICMRVDGTVSHSITVGRSIIHFRDILSIEADGIFDEDREYDAL